MFKHAGNSFLSGALITPYLKYCTVFSFFCFLTTSSLILHCITLLANIADLFWGTDFFFSFSFLFLQFQAKCLNFLQH